MTLLKTQMKKQVIIFLDLDGVLCVDNLNNSRMLEANLLLPESSFSEYWSKLVDANAAANLLELYAEFSPSFVISSSWATYFEKYQIAEIFGRTGLNFIVPALHGKWRTERALSSSRRDEIEAWLQTYRTNFEPFLVLDDDRSGWSLSHSPLAYDGHVVLCNSADGFVKSKLAAARQILQRQLSNTV